MFGDRQPLSTVVTDRNELWLCFWMGFWAASMLCWLVFLPWVVVVLSLFSVSFCLARSIMVRQP